MLNRIIGPIPKSGVQINRFGVIPKIHEPGKWRIIVDLSSPDKASVNDGISQELCSLNYVSVDDVVQLVLELARVIADQIGHSKCYRIVPVHPVVTGLDRHTLTQCYYLA